MRRARSVMHGALDHDPGGEPRCAVLASDVAADDGKARAGVSALENVKTVVEVMVAERGRGKVERVHDGDDRMGRLVVLRHRLGGEIAERRALQNVAVVEQQAVGRFLARLDDQRCGARETDRIIGTVAIVIVRVEIGVQIRHAHESQGKARRNASGMERHIVLALGGAKAL